MIQSVAASNNWGNVNNAIACFKKDDKIIMKIINFIPNVIRLIANTFIDLMQLFRAKFSMQNTQDSQKPSTYTKKINDFWNNPMRKIIFPFGKVSVIAGIVALITVPIHYYYSRWELHMDALVKQKQLFTETLKVLDGMRQI